MLLCSEFDVLSRYIASLSRMTGGENRGHGRVALCGPRCDGLSCPKIGRFKNLGVAFEFVTPTPGGNGGRMTWSSAVVGNMS